MWGFSLVLHDPEGSHYRNLANPKSRASNPKTISNDKAQMPNKTQNSNNKEEEFQHLSIWISIVIWNLASEIAAHLTGARNDISPFVFARRRSKPKQSPTKRHKGKGYFTPQNVVRGFSLVQSQNCTTLKGRTTIVFGI